MEITIMRLKNEINAKARDYYNLLLKHEFSEDIGVGFKDLNIEDNNLVSGVAIKRSAVFVNVFDKALNDFVEQEQFIIAEIDFVIDTINKLIEIYAPAKGVKKLLSVFIETLSSDVQLEPVKISPAKILEEFQVRADDCEITKLHIKDFSSEKGVIGSYDIKSIDTNLAWEYVSKYKDSVVKSTTTVSEGDIQAVTQVFQNGKFKITTKPRNQSNIILYIIKDLISKTNTK